MPFKKTVKIKELAIKYGMEGKAVLECQKLLQKHGSTIKLTGKYTVGMISAVKAFQRRNGLEPTGKIDTVTMGKLEEFKASATRKKTGK